MATWAIRGMDSARRSRKHRRLSSAPSPAGILPGRLALVTAPTRARSCSSSCCCWAITFGESALEERHGRRRLHRLQLTLCFAMGDERGGWGIGASGGLPAMRFAYFGASDLICCFTSGLSRAMRAMIACASSGFSAICASVHSPNFVTY